MRKVVLGSLLAVSLLAVGCAPTSPQGTFYSSAKVPSEATANAVGDKSGKACRSTILGLQPGGLISFGDASIQTAAKDGGINKISSVSHEHMNVLFFFSKDCTVVNGQ